MTNIPILYSKKLNAIVINYNNRINNKMTDRKINEHIQQGLKHAKSVITELELELSKRNSENNIVLETLIGNTYASLKSFEELRDSTILNMRKLKENNDTNIQIIKQELHLETLLNRELTSNLLISDSNMVDLRDKLAELANTHNKLLWNIEDLTKFFE
jgi:hypothetical protein